MFGGCSNDHTVNWPGEVCDLNTCTDPTAQLNDGAADGEELMAEDAAHSPSPDPSGGDSGSGFPTVAIASGGAALAVVILAAVGVVWWLRSSKRYLNDELQQPILQADTIVVSAPDTEYAMYEDANEFAT